MEVDYVFVYGTLRQGDCRSNVFDPHSQVADECFIDGFDMLHIGGFPGLVPGCGRIRGEVYQIDERLLQTLDSIEGYYEEGDKNNLYNREIVDVFYDDGGSLVNADGEGLRAYVYVFNRDSRDYDTIPSGDWFNQDAQSDEHAGVSYWKERDTSADQPGYEAADGSETS